VKALLRQGLMGALAMVMMSPSAWTQGLSLPTESAVKNIDAALQGKAFTTIEASERIGLVQDFVSHFKKLNADAVDDALEAGGDLAAAAAWSDFKHDISEVVALYQSARPVLLANIQLHLRDEAAMLNKGALYDLFFFTKRHQQRNQPFSGLLTFTLSDGQALGIAAHQPAWLGEEVVQQALLMEAELQVIREKHSYYMDIQPREQEAKRNEKIKEVRKEIRKPNRVSEVQVDVGAFVAISDKALAQVQPSLQHEIDRVEDDALPINTRMSLVHDFAQACKHLDDLGLGSAEALSWEEAVQVAKKNDFEMQLKKLVAHYQEVRPVLLRNIKLQREDEAPQVNVGDLLSLFYSYRRNYHTAKPISGLLRHKAKASVGWFEEKMIDAGVLVQFPELEQADAIQAAISLETELAALLQMHQDYLND